MAFPIPDSINEDEIIKAEQWATDVAAQVKTRLIAGSWWSYSSGVPPGPPTIFKVPDDIRETDPRSYDPHVLSIGPYHHHSSTNYPLNRYKSYCVRYLLSLNGSEELANEFLHSCLAKLKASSRRIKHCYSEGDIGLTDDQLTELMLLDGCFIIWLLFIDGLLFQEQQGHEKSDDIIGEVPADARQHISIYIRDDVVREQLLNKSWIQKLVKFDLLKLDNQIPFFVIEELLKILEIPFSMERLASLALENFSGLLPVKSANFQPRGSKRFFHLLHLFHSSLHGESGSKMISVEKKPLNPIFEEIMLSATELQRIGLKFKKKRDAQSFLDVSFHGGALEIPPLQVLPYTGFLLRNLIAFEQFCPLVESRVTTYVIMMDCLIDTAQDVSILQMSGIIDNRLSTGQAAADLFNSFKINVNPNLNNHYLREVFIEVNRFREIKWRQWLASLKRDYLGNPWKIVSVIAAIVLLALTLVQSFFAVFAYLRPPK